MFRITFGLTGRWLLETALADKNPEAPRRVGKGGSLTIVESMHPWVW